MSEKQIGLKKYAASLTLEDRVKSLTEREREVAFMVAEGKSNLEIAGELYLSVGTVKTHIRNILGKMNKNSRIQIAIDIIAYQRSQETPPEPRLPFEFFPVEIKID